MQEEDKTKEKAIETANYFHKKVICLAQDTAFVREITSKFIKILIIN